MSASKLALIIYKFLLQFLYGEGDCRNNYRGTIPINLDAPFNMGAEANELYHPELGHTTWMQLLARLSFNVNWQGEIPVVEMHYHHTEFDFTLTAECPYSIKLEMIHCSGDPRVYEYLSFLLESVLIHIMHDIIKPLQPAPLHQECVCLADWIPKPPARPAICKRKHNEVDDE